MNEQEKNDSPYVWALSQKSYLVAWTSCPSVGRLILPLLFITFFKKDHGRDAHGILGRDVQAAFETEPVSIPGIGY